MITNTMPDRDNKIDFLQKIELFKHTPARVLAKIARNLKTVEVDSGQSIFEKGDSMRALYIVVEGSLQVHDGDYIFSTFDENDFFGEYSLIDEETRSASVTAIIPSVLYELSYTDFSEWLDKEPLLAKTLLKGFVRRLRDNNILEERLTRRTLEIQKQKNEIIRERDDLEKQRKDLLTLNNTKDKFFSIIGHDLKNPFSTVIGLSDLLLDDFDSFERDRLKVFIEQINKFSSNAYALLENLLQWARSQTGKMKINKNLFNFKDVVEDNVDLLSGNARQKNITVNFPSEAAYWNFDINMISTVVRNLVSNAIKFTPVGGQIHIDYKEHDDRIVVSIADNGIGIPVKDQDKLFRLDVNPSTIGTSDEKGTGLGLILCSEFVERHDGKIWVESEPGKGSIFKFYLPKI
ncbi:MAG: ATP-binding protein [Salinivirgaceae bacterium]|jgi:two-component system sensor histidine kinase/response regulator|nr:ATP-binding protein [Salinivirgaceae bacterium]